MSFVIKNPSSGIWSCPFSIIGIASKTFPNGYDVIWSIRQWRRFEKVKNGHIFENWTSIWDWTSIWVLHIFFFFCNFFLSQHIYIPTFFKTRSLSYSFSAELAVMQTFINCYLFFLFFAIFSLPTYIHPHLLKTRSLSYSISTELAVMQTFIIILLSIFFLQSFLSQHIYIPIF